MSILPGPEKLEPRMTFWNGWTADWVRFAKTHQIHTDTK